MKEISLLFKLETNAGAKEDFVIKNVKENVTEEEINVYCDKIIREEYLSPKDGTKYVSVAEITKVVLTKEKIM